MRRDRWYQDYFGDSVFLPKTIQRQADFVKQREAEKADFEEGFSFDFEKEPDLSLWDVMESQEINALDLATNICESAMREYGEAYPIDARANHALDGKTRKIYMGFVLKAVTEMIEKMQ